MKQTHHIGPLIAPLIATVLLSSCILPEHDVRRSPRRSGYAVYTVLPDRFVGSVYYYDGRYYTGGTYQTGTFTYRGRPYSSRYHYRGTYMYGGRYHRHGPKARIHRRHHRRHWHHTGPHGRR